MPLAAYLSSVQAELKSVRELAKRPKRFQSFFIEPHQKTKSLLDSDASNAGSNPSFGGVGAGRLAAAAAAAGKGKKGVRFDTTARRRRIAKKKVNELTA